MSIGIVTDSTADLPVEYYESHNVTMVPLVVRFGDEVFRDWIDIKPDEFFKRLKTSNILPKTSQPSAGDFIGAYEKLAGEGCEHIISIHISAHLSGTLTSAKAALQDFKKVPVTLIDSEQTSALLGAFVMELAEAREGGASLDDLLRVAERCKRRGKIFFVVDTLKYLELGGRIGKARALLGSMLSIKPILTLEEGVVTPVAKVKGAHKARRELISLLKREVAKRPPGDKVKVLVASTDNPAEVPLLEEAIKEAAVRYDELGRGQVGAVIGTYTGPGTYAVCVL